jgi:GTPase SAR1 family protein
MSKVCPGILIGDPKVGKSSLLEALSYGPPLTYYCPSVPWHFDSQAAEIFILNRHRMEEGRLVHNFIGTIYFICSFRLYCLLWTQAHKLTVILSDSKPIFRSTETTQKQTTLKVWSSTIFKCQGFTYRIFRDISFMVKETFSYYASTFRKKHHCEMW